MGRIVVGAIVCGADVTMRTEGRTVGVRGLAVGTCVVDVTLMSERQLDGIKGWEVRG